jgi:pimeloyl-ACP methyl ester carboxylesterase
MEEMALPDSFEQLIGKERISLIREMTLVHRDLAPVVPEARPGDSVVVLVHGFCASAGVFRPLRARLEREAGARVGTFTHAPCVGIRRIARTLSDLVDRIPRETQITVVGHSLGGVVARWYVQEMGGHARVARTISLGSPFGGLDVPRYLVGADLHESSTLLERLRARASEYELPHTSVVAAEDRMVVGLKTACLGVGDVVVLERRGHNALLFDEEVAGLVIDRVRQTQAQRVGAVAVETLESQVAP